MGGRPDSTLDQRNIVIWMQTVGMINMQLARHVQACECMMSSLTTKIRQTGSVRNRHHADRPRKTTMREDIDNVTLFRRYRFLSSARVSGLVRNSTGFVPKQFKYD